MATLNKISNDRSQAEWLTPASAAKYLDSTPKALESWRRHGTGPAFSRVGRIVRYRKADIDQWLTNARREAKR